MSRPQHVYPVDDAVGHELEGDECPCGPDVEFVDGARVITHHSLDGREFPPEKCEECNGTGRRDYAQDGQLLRDCLCEGCGGTGWNAG